MGAREGAHIIEVADNHRVSIALEETTSSGGPIRGWKRLARERVAMEQVSTPNYAKRGIQEVSKMVEDLYKQSDDVLTLKV